MKLPECIISMTSWRRRINDVGMVIFSFLKLEPVCNFKVVLVLSSDEFPDREEELPKDLLLLKKHPRFEILWCTKNSKAYKKYFPTARKYPTVPIITVDDDAPAKPNFLSTLWKLHKKDPKRVIYGYDRVPQKRTGIDYVRYGVGMFPPGSLFNLDEEFGMSVFGDMDDEFFRLLHVLAGTKNFSLNAYDVLYIQAINQDSALGAQIGLQWKLLDSKWNDMFKRMPELKKRWDWNVGKSNA